MISKKYSFKTKLDLLEYYIATKNNNLKTSFFTKTNIELSGFEIINFTIFKHLKNENKIKVFEFIKNTNNLKILNCQYSNLKAIYFEKYNLALTIVFNKFELNKFAISRLDPKLILEILKVKKNKKTELIFSNEHFRINNLDYIDKILECDKLVDYLVDISSNTRDKSVDSIETELVFTNNNFDIGGLNWNSLLILLVLIDKEKHPFFNIEDINLSEIDIRALEYVFNNYSFKNSYVENHIKLNLL